MLNSLQFKSATPLAASIAAGVLALFATGANAAQIIGYGQTGGVNTASLVANGTNTATTLTDADVAIFVTNYAGALLPFAATLNISAASTNAATLVAGIIHQDYSGTFCITSASACGGINYLSGTFIDDYSAQTLGSQFTLGASTPPSSAVTFTSSVLTAGQLLAERAVSFSFSNVSPVADICGTTVCSATASQTGTASANIGQVPEPATLGLVGIALAGLGFSRRRKQG